MRGQITESDLKQFLWSKVEALFKEQVQRAYAMGWNAAMREVENERRNSNHS